MSEITFREHSSVTLVRADASDWMIAEDARLSTKILPAPSELEKNAGLVKALMRERHGTPFEAPHFTFEIEAPIFVAREAHRHRIASISEMSGRYVELQPIFWVPPKERDLVQVPGSKQMAYLTQPGTDEQYARVRQEIRESCIQAWEAYQSMLADDVLKEVARVVLPTSIFTRWRLRINLRSALNFLSLRVRTRPDEPAPMFPSKPQIEIDEVARQMEEIIKQFCPISIAAFNEGGRVAP